MQTLTGNLTTAIRTGALDIRCIARGFVAYIATRSVHLSIVFGVEVGDLVWLTQPSVAAGMLAG